MADLLKAEEELQDVFTFQLIDVKILDKLPSSFEYSDEIDIHGDTFLETTCDLEGRYTDKSSVIMIGCTDKGNSILVRVHEFQPYLFYKKAEKMDLFRNRLANLIELRDADQLNITEILCKNLYGWEPNKMENPTDRKEHIYYKVYFPNVRFMRKAIQKTKAHECQITAETKFMDEYDIIPSGWIEVSGDRVDKEDRISHCRIELETNMRNIKPLPEKSDIAPLMIAAIDIECTSATGAFPDANIREDYISMIGAVYWRNGTSKEEAVKCVYVYGDCADIEGSHVYKFDTEKEMLSYFRTSFLFHADPDIIATYNGFGFDLEYLWTRAEKILGCEDFCYLDRLIVSKSKAEKKELSSSALGSNELFIISMVGRCNLDIFHWIKAREKLESYKLDNVCEHFLGEHKLDMDYKELFKMVRGTREQVAEVALYCIQDCALLIALILRLQIISGNVEMSRVCFTAMEALVTRGQQFKVMNQLVHYGHREGRRENGDGAYVLNTPERYSGGADDSYEGATVIDAKASYYTKPIAVLDFMSLYPSIMMANNFCFSTIVMDPRFLNIPGVEYVTIKVTEKKIYTWAKGMPGLLPIMLEKLLGARKIAKKAKANAKNDVEKAVYDSRQLALKISANSIYGFTGAVKMGKYHCLGIADSTTFRAREMLHQTQSWVKELYPCDVVYGDTDSIMVLFEDGNTKEEAFALGDDASEKITQMFSEKYNTNKIVLEMEKVYLPYLLMRKKRYAGLMYEKNKKGEVAFSYLDAKGIELVRRDNCAIAKRVQSNVLDALMYKMDPEQACAQVHEHMEKIVKNEVPLMDYKMSKSRRKEYKNEELPHLEVVRKMRQRNPGSEPQVGDRVPFILIETSDLKAKACEKAEDPKYIEEKQLKVDRLYYTEHQIVNPICSLLDLVIDDPKKLFVDHIRTLTNQRKSQNTIFSFLKRKPEEIMSVNNVAQSEQSLDQYDKSKDENAAADVVESVSSCTNERDVLIIEKEAASAFEDAMMNMGSTTRIVKNPPKKKKKVAAK
tara:strand:- start:2653 stop:5709 length:3057 start_codon:yes stop_codon:yes gene_type:complete